MGGVPSLSQKVDLNLSMKMAYASKSKNFLTPYPPHFPQPSLSALDYRISELKKRIKAEGSPG